MKHYNRIWKLKEADKSESAQLSESLGISDILSDLMVQRGLTTPNEAKRFLEASSDWLLDPYALKGMALAVDRIRKAMKAKEQIWIYGDYDVDGITSISILVHYFNGLDYPVQYYIPDRLTEGYGISQKGIEHLHQQGCQLLITVDCGITAVEQVKYANAAGIDVIITDHHEPQEELPEAYCIINHKQTDCTYSEQILSGVGIAFKLIQGLDPECIDREMGKELLQIAAIGTVADIVPLTGENRIIVKQGIEAIRFKPLLGVEHLIKASGINQSKLSAGQIGFMIAPRLNASGRIDNPQKGVRLLLTQDGDEAKELAEELSVLNDERQRIERQIFEEAVEQIEKEIQTHKGPFLVAYSQGWHPGVIGIVASRIVEKYYKPCILLNVENGIAKGSGRSIEGYSLFEALNVCKEWLIKYGGHEMAAGLTLSEEHIDALKKDLNDHAQMQLNEELLTPKLHASAELDPKYMNFDLLEELEAMEPFGQCNPKPVFLYKNLKIDQKRLMGKNKEHLKIVAHDGNRVYEAIGFRWPNSEAYKPGKKVDLAFTLERNSFNGVDSLQMLLKDGRIREWRDYQNSGWFKAYWRTLWPAILSSEKLEIIKPSKVGFDTVSKLISEHTHLIENEKRAAILVWTPESYEEAIGVLQDIDIQKRPKILWGESTPQNGVVVIVNPKMNPLDLTPYDFVALWDRPPLEKIQKGFGLSPQMVKNVHNKESGAALTETIAKSIPSKYELAECYREIRKSIQWVWDKNKQLDTGSNPVETLKIEVMLWILEKNKLIEKVQTPEMCYYILVEQEGNKINILDSEPYRFITHYRSGNERQYKKKNMQEGNHEI